VWIDPWSAEGQAVSAKVLPLAPELRRHAERAVELVTQARLANPDLRETDALTALDLGARRLDLIGMKFEFAQEIADGYARAAARPHDKEHDGDTQNILEEIAGDNGLCEDLRDAYGAVKTQYTQVWLSENRSWWLNSVTVRYDLAIEEWQRRGIRIETANRSFGAGKPLPAATDLGIPASIVGK
jgi:hypothetical protein